MYCTGKTPGWFLDMQRQDLFSLQLSTLVCCLRSVPGHMTKTVHILTITSRIRKQWEPGPFRGGRGLGTGLDKCIIHTHNSNIAYICKKSQQALATEYM